MGSDTPIDDIQEQVTETETIDPYGNDPYGTEHHYVTPDKKRSFGLPTFGLSGILKGLKNQFKINPEKQKEFDSWEENKNQKGWGYMKALEEKNLVWLIQPQDLMFYKIKIGRVELVKVYKNKLMKKMHGSQTVYSKVKA
jgi:hypothetical protein